jgi:3-methyl-2-oxobutanoate hydroxymethyltransferase
MSTALPINHKRLSVRDIGARKGGAPIVCITSYSAPMAKLMDDHVDVLLVGDSIGMVLYGLENTLAVSVDMMVNHGAAVVRGSQTSCVIVDMPFGSYQGSPEAAFDAAAHIMSETGCAGVKLEGGCVMAETIEFLVSRGVPVMGHVGMTPQSANVFGGYKTQGKSDEDARLLLEDAKAVADSGIGASPACDGQIIVAEDILGIFQDFTPKFVKRYAELGAVISDAVQTYADEVRARTFPSPRHLYGVKKG